MERRKHKNDTKANTHRDRWERGKGCRWNYKHSDWTIDGKLKKLKIFELELDKLIILGELNEI